MKQKVTKKSQRGKRCPPDASDGSINQHACLNNVRQVKKQASKKIRRKYAEMRKLWRAEIQYELEVCELRGMQQQLCNLRLTDECELQDMQQQLCELRLTDARNATLNKDVMNNVRHCAQVTNDHQGMGE